jgi:hypothetical protein
LPKFL